MSLLGNTEYIKTSSGEYIEIRRGMFHTHVTLPDGSELELDTDYDELIKLLEKWVSLYASSFLFVFIWLFEHMSKYSDDMWKN